MDRHSLRVIWAANALSVTFLTVQLSPPGGTVILYEKRFRVSAQIAAEIPSTFCARSSNSVGNASKTTVFSTDRLRFRPQLSFLHSAFLAGERIFRIKCSFANGVPDLYLLKNRHYRNVHNVIAENLRSHVPFSASNYIFRRYIHEQTTRRSLCR